MDFGVQMFGTATRPPVRKVRPNDAAVGSLEIGADLLSQGLPFVPHEAFEARTALAPFIQPIDGRDNLKAPSKGGLEGAVIEHGQGQAVAVFQDLIAVLGLPQDPDVGLVAPGLMEGL